MLHPADPPVGPILLGDGLQQTKRCSAACGQLGLHPHLSGPTALTRIEMAARAAEQFDALDLNTLADQAACPFTHDTRR